MEKSAELKRFEADMEASEELRKQYDETVMRIVADQKAQSKSEAYAKGAEELGYHIGIAELERLRAEMEELSADELAPVSGGVENINWCWHDYACSAAWKHDDTHGSNTMCAYHYYCGVTWNWPQCDSFTGGRGV